MIWTTIAHFCLEHKVGEDWHSIDFWLPAEGGGFSVPLTALTAWQAADDTIEKLRNLPPILRINLSPEVRALAVEMESLAPWYDLDKPESELVRSVGVELRCLYDVFEEYIDCPLRANLRQMMDVSSGIGNIRLVMLEVTL